MELTLIFIDQHAEQFRSQKEQSDFLLEALTCESLTATLEDKQQNLNKRKARTNNGTSEFGKNSSMKQFFNLAAQTLETTLPELNISGKDLYYWWRISSDSASNQLCEILLITDKKTLKESLLEWQKTNITDRKPLSSKAAEENSENPLTQPTTSTYSENIILIDEYNGAKTPFNSSFEKICKTASSEVINAILDRLTRLRQGHWGDFKHIESMKGVRELRIHQDQGWRIYLYKTEDNKFLLLDVCPKCDQVRDIERLRALKYSD
jgi:putative addiction module killer protein